MTFAVIAGFLVVLGVWLTSLYNRLVILRNRVKNGFAQIDVQLKRRYDLIPNLVEATKAYMTYEKETLTKVIEARNNAFTARNAAAENTTSAAAIGALGAAENQLSNLLTRFMALTESYPDLKGNENVKTLMEELCSSENKVSFSRQAFNDAVTAYNSEVESFPVNVVAGPLGFTPSALLESTKSEIEREVPKVSFS